MTAVHYKEVQKLDQWWMKTLLVFSSLVMLGGILMGYFQEAAKLPADEANDLLAGYLLILFAVGVAVAALIFFILSHRLEIEIDTGRLRYKFFPWMGWKEVRPDQLKGFEIKPARFVWKFGGWGLRYNPFIGQWAYLVKGRYALTLYFNSRRPLTITTLHPQEMRTAMEAFMAKK